jgi:hypothetical protein
MDLDEEERDAIRFAWLDMVASLKNYHNNVIGSREFARGACEIADAMAESVIDLEKAFCFLKDE